jgi:hypothetical protein
LKKILKVLKILLIIVISLAIIVYGGVFLGHKVFFPIKTSNVPTIEAVTDGIFTLGLQPNPPMTLDEFIPLLAGQLKRYNEVAFSLWPDNANAGQSLIVEGVKSKKLYLIAPDGTVTPLLKNEALSYGFNRNTYTDGFSFFEGGMYYAINESDLTNYLKWQKYLHIGTHDALMFLTHEGFHAKEQPKWLVMDNIPNRGRNEFLEDTSARAKRALLQKQLLRAVNQSGNTQLILDALATYEDYKKLFPDDYKNSLYIDRVEGTAYYYELITGLYAGYPDQIKNTDDLDHALALLASREDNYVWHGLATEAYIVGGFSCVLLDRLDNDWKERLINDPEATPIEMLYQHFKDETLPTPIQITQADIDEVVAEIQKPNAISPTARIFRFFYELLF